ncbi:MAG: PH domain-containing protein [Thermoplasmata archaeon]|nr:PH domain-containing protein [Thermoplasmata archaeon]
MNSEAQRPGGERIRNIAPWSPGTVGVYVFIVALLLATSTARQVSSFPFINELLAVLFLIFLIRYMSVRYRMDADRLVAWRVFGSRSVPYSSVRRIVYANLRQLGPVSYLGTWGWHGRMWSPLVGSFDSIHTVSDGVMIFAGNFPLFVSPRDPPAFARELSRRVRSYTGPLEEDVGAPPEAGETGATAGAASR